MLARWGEDRKPLGELMPKERNKKACLNTGLLWDVSCQQVLVSESQCRLLRKHFEWPSFLPHGNLLLILGYDQQQIHRTF